MSKSALSPHVKQSEKKILNPDSDPDQQNSAKLVKSPHKEATYKISSPSDCKLQRRRRLKFLSDEDDEDDDEDDEDEDAAGRRTTTIAYGLPAGKLKTY